MDSKKLPRSISTWEDYIGKLAKGTLQNHPVQEGGHMPRKIQLRNKCLIASATCQVSPRSCVAYEDTTVPRERLGRAPSVQVPHRAGLYHMLTLCYLDSPISSHSLLCLAPSSSTLTTDPELAHFLLNSPRPLPMLRYLSA